jgi:hypothetical protein
LIFLLFSALSLLEDKRMALLDNLVFFLVFTLLFIVEEMDFFSQFFLSLNVIFQLFFRKVFGRAVFVKLFASFEKFV